MGPETAAVRLKRRKLRIVMKWLLRSKQVLAVAALFWLTLPNEAYAYIDPGTGSYMFQMMIGFLIGALFAAKLFWQRIRNFFSRLFASEERTEKDEK